MDRREFLSFKKTSLQEDFGKPKIERRTTTGLAKYSGTWTKQEVAHLLRRTLFGPKSIHLQRKRFPKRLIHF